MSFSGIPAALSHHPICIWLFRFPFKVFKLFLIHLTNRHLGQALREEIFQAGKLVKSSLGF
jgi:hypothetical protein